MSAFLSQPKHGDLCASSITWCLACVAVMLALVAADAVSPLSTQLFAGVCFFLVIVLTYKTWRQTEQGNHPIFLFMLFLILFQYGRLVSWAAFGHWSIWDFDLTTPTPFRVNDADLKRSLLLIPLSATFVYLGFFYRKGPTVLQFARNEQMRRFFGWLFVLTIPFVVYKDATYLEYTMTHGGYVATYLDNGAHLKEVGLLIRAIALLNTAAYLPYLVVEDRKRWLTLSMVTYMVVMVLELLVGFRGLFFTNLMFLWMVYNIKTGRSFRPITGTVVGVLFALAAIAANVFRGTSQIVHLNLVEYFLRSEGVSFYVTASSVMYYARFHPHAWAYIVNQFWLPYRLLNQFPPGSLFTLDLTAFLNPYIVNYALGTGEAYIAHLYLLGGITTVCIGSFLLGAFTRWISQARRMFWRTIALAILMWIPYMPRAGYLEPLATSTKYFIIALPAFGLYAAFIWLRATLRAILLRKACNA